MRASSGPYKAEHIAQACRGTIVFGNPAVLFEAISTDSRNIREGDLFVPLKGTNFDGHDFLIPALEAGARGSLISRDVNREICRSLTEKVLIQVQDTLLALSDLALAHRERYPIPLIAVTGSSGKTTVKEMIATILRQCHTPLVSSGNFNNLIGLPMTILQIGPQHSAAVVEAGINTIGEMDHLARAASPNVAVITTIGPVHLEGLGSIENVAREKFKLVNALGKDGTAVVPATDSYIKEMVRYCPYRIFSFGLTEGNFRASQIKYSGQETVFQINSPFGNQEICLPIPGRHNVTNALAAAAAASAIGIPLGLVAEALREFTLPNWRLEIIELPGSRILIRDCYNANPQSVRAALEVLSNRSNAKKIAVLADMMELGELSNELHRQIGKDAAELEIDEVIFVGKFGRYFEDGFVSSGGNKDSIKTVPDKETAWNLISPRLQEFGSILVKGSRLMKMETIADLILKGN